jgi:hypothetical protein
VLQGDKWIFAAPDPAVVGIDLTTDMKRALITEYYAVHKSLLYRLVSDETFAYTRCGKLTSIFEMSGLKEKGS